MKECVSCGSNEIVKNLNTGKTFCYDCKSDKVYGKCLECGDPIKDEGCDIDGSDGWHDNNKRYKPYSNSDEMVSCWENHKINEMVDADCS